MVSLKSLLTPRRAQTNARPPQSTPAAPLAYLFDNGQLTPIKSGYFESGGADSNFGVWSRGSGYHELYQDDQGYAQAYATCEWVFRAVNVKTQKISDVLRQGKVIGTDGQPIANHPLIQAFNEGYRRYQRSVFKQWPYNKSIFGETYVHIEKATFGLIQIPRAVRVLNSLYTEPVIFNNEISHFTYEGGGTSQNIPWSDMVYDINIDPRDDTRGLSDVAVALDSVNIDRSLIIVTKNWLKNNARPGIIFTPKNQTLSPGDIDLIKTVLAERVKGPQNAGKPLLMPTPMDVTATAPPSLEDQQYLTDDKKRRICTAIGVPTALVDYTDMAFQLSEEQARNFYDLTVIPGAQDIVDLINVSLMPMFDRSGATFTIPVEDILSRLQDPNTARQAASTALQGGALTLNETRKKHGVEPVTGGDVFFFPTGIVPVPANQLGNAGALISASRPQPMLPPGNPPQPSAPPPVLPVRSVTFDPTPVQPVRPKPRLVKGSSVGTPEAYTILSFANDPQLIAFQDKLKTLLPNIDGIRWTPPGEFHLTLTYATLVSDDQLETVISENDTWGGLFPASATTQPLSSFDQETQKVLILPIEKSPELVELQKTLYEMFTGWMGFTVPMSEYSAPDQWKPHITLAYVDASVEVPELPDVFGLTPQEVIFSRGDYANIYSLSPARAGFKKQAAPEDELRAWRRKVKQGGIGKSFVCYAIPKHVEAFVRDELAAGAEYGGVFDDAAALLNTANLKAYEDTRAAFVDEIMANIGDGQADEVTKAKFAGQMRAITRRFGLEAFRDGMNEVGVDPESFSPEDLAVFRDWQAETSGYISNFANEVFGEGITKSEVQTRADMWASMTLEDVRQRGILAAKADQPMEWVEDGTLDKCPDCLRLNGQVHTMAEWVKSGWTPTSKKTACKSFNCQCRLVPTDQPERGDY